MYHLFLYYDEQVKPTLSQRISAALIVICSITVISCSPQHRSEVQAKPTTMPTDQSSTQSSDTRLQESKLGIVKTSQPLRWGQTQFGIPVDPKYLYQPKKEQEIAIFAG